MLIFALLLEEVQNCATVGTEPFRGTDCDKIKKIGRAATALQ